MRFLILTLILLIHLGSLRAEISVYIDSGSESPDIPDGSPEAPYLAFDDAFAKSISTLMKSDNVIVIFMNAEEPYEFSMTYIADPIDNYEYNLIFQSNITDPLVDLASCEQYPSLMFKSSDSKTLQIIEELQASPQPFIFKSNYLTIQFQNLNLVAKPSDDNEPFPGLSLIQASQSAEVHYKDVCFVYNNLAILNTTKESAYAFASGGIVNVNFQNIAMNAEIRITEPSEESQRKKESINKNNPANQIQLISLFQLSSMSKKQTTESFSQLIMDNFVLTQNIVCDNCQYAQSLVEISMFTIGNIPNVALSNIFTSELHSELNNYLFYYQSQQPSSTNELMVNSSNSSLFVHEEKDDEVLSYKTSFTNTSITDATNTTFLQLNSGALLELNLEQIQASNIVIYGRPFISIKGTDSDPIFSVKFHDFALKDISITMTPFINFDIKVPKDINSIIQIADFKLESGVISNANEEEEKSKALPFIQSNYPISIEEGSFTNNQWDTVLVFQGTDIPLNLFKVSGTSFADETYTKSVLFSQIHKTPTTQNSPSEVRSCNFNNLNFGENSSFVLNQGLMFIFNENTLDGMTINDGQFIGSNNPPLRSTPYDKNILKVSRNTQDPPEECLINCYYIEISGNTISNLNFNTERNYPLFPIIRPLRMEQAYAVLTQNNFDTVTTQYPFVYTLNIDSVDFSGNIAANIETPQSLLNITGNTSTFSIKENTFSSTSALDFISYINKDINLVPTISIEGNTLDSSTFKRTFITVKTPHYDSLAVNSNKIINSKLVCPSDIAQCRGIAISSTAHPDSTFNSQGNEFQSTSLSIEEDRDGYQPNFDNSLMDIQITSTETITVQEMAFNDCTMDAVFSSLLTIGGDEIEIDTLKISGNSIQNLNFNGAVYLVGNKFTLSNIEISGNNIESDKTRHGFLTSAFKIENPIAGDDPIEVNIQSLTIQENDLSQLESIMKITLPNLNLHVEGGMFGKSPGKYILINSQSFEIEMKQITYESASDSNVLYIGQGKGSIQIEDYKDSAGEGNNGPAFYLENTEEIAFTMSSSIIQNPQLLFVNLANSQLNFKEVTLDKIPSCNGLAQSVITVLGKQIEINFESLYLTDNNAPGNAVFRAGLNATDIIVKATGILSKSSIFSSFFDISQFSKTSVKVSNSVFDQNVYSLTNYGDFGNKKTINANNEFSLTDSILTAHLGSFLKTTTSNSGDFGFKNIIASGTTHNVEATSNRPLFSVSAGITTNPSTPKIQLIDSTLMGITDAKIPGILGGTQTALMIDATNFVNNTFLNTSSSTPVFHLQANSSTVKITNSNFLMNTATYSSGCISLSNSDYDISGCNFFSNLGNTGGAVYTANSISNTNKTIPDSNNFANNNALTFGNDATGDVGRIKVEYLNACPEYNATLFAKYLNDELVYIQSNLYNVANFSLFAWNCKVMVLSFLDIYEKSIQINPNETTIISSTGIQPVYNCNSTYCTLNISSLQTQSEENSVKLAFNVSLSPNSPAQTSVTFKFLPRPCMSGEYTLNDKKCRICPPHTFSFNNNSDCQPCPVAPIQGLCLGGDVFFVQPENWREPDTSHFYKCPDDLIGRCEGGADPENQCSAGYSGALCLTCDTENQYGPSMFNSKCSKCSESIGAEVIFAILLFLGGFLFEILYIIVINASNKASSAVDNIRNENFNAEQYYLGAYLSFAVTQIQLLFITLKYLKFLFPNYASIFQAISGPIGLIASPSTFGRTAVECILANSNEDPLVIFKFKVFIESFLPLTKTIVIVVFIMVLYAMDKIKRVKNLITISIFSMLFLEQTPAFLNLIQSMTCYLGDISPPGFTKSDLRVSCGDLRYESFKAYFILPTAVFWGAIILLGTGISIIVAKKKCQAQEVKRLFGDFVSNYKDKSFYWGIILIVMKLLLIISLNLITDPAEAIIPSMLIFLAYYQGLNYLLPYNSRELRKLDQMNSLAFIAVMLLAVFGYNSSGRMTKTLSFFALTLLCIGILVYTLYQLIKRIFRYVKAWKRDKNTNPRASGLLSFTDSFEGNNEAAP